MDRIRGGKLSFKKFLERGISRGDFGDGPESDFARDALRDRTLRDYEEWEWEYLDSHIMINGGCVEARQAAKDLFRKWRAS